MFETNVLGLMRMTRALLPRLVASGDGHVVNVTSIAALQGYPGGSGYNAAKFGAHGVTESLRHELLGQPVRVTEILPGMVETEFSVVRLDGDQDRADARLRRADAADRRRRRRVHPVGRGAAVARQHRPDRGQAPRPGRRLPIAPRALTPPSRSNP